MKSRKYPSFNDPANVRQMPVWAAGQANRSVALEDSQLIAQGQILQ
jgi:hypothetical protein